MAHCVFCDARLRRPRLDETEEAAPRKGVRQAYDPELGRLWDICPRCERWNPVPVALRWELLEEWERRVREEGRFVLKSTNLALIRVGQEEVVRVGIPSLTEWGGWRYGDRLPRLRPRGLVRAALAALPPAPLEGYDPYGLTGPMGGVGGRYGPREWLASPFLEHARPLTAAYTSVPFANACPSCRSPMLLRPWDFARVGFHIGSNRVRLEADCASCETRVALELEAARPALRLGLGILDSDAEARAVGERAGSELERIGGGRVLLRALADHRVALGELDRTERVGLGIALDQEAEAENLEAEWREAEEIAAIMDGELTEVPGFREFRARVLGQLT